MHTVVMRYDTKTFSYSSNREELQTIRAKQTKWYKAM
jgi:hypothetical protein